MKTVTVQVKNCARCHRDHANLVFKSLTHKVEDGEKWTHWALCPTNGEPVLMKIKEKVK